MKRGATVVMEWPKSCDYWRHKRVQAFLTKHGFQDAEVHGCAVGLRSIVKNTEGLLVKKRWRLSTNDEVLASRLSRACLRDHQHIPLVGRDVKASESYSPGFAAHVCGALRDAALAASDSVPGCHCDNERRAWFHPRDREHAAAGGVSRDQMD